ncbi:MAG: cytochrome c biogenesis protein ResB [Elusimicrobia bacterium]|nr:cytochrome c biogenesis protein ResB [Elusimicrobiota bacterium]
MKNLTRVVEVLRSRAAALALLAGLGAFALAGAFALEETADALFAGTPFRLLAAALAAGLTAVLTRWAPGLRRPASWGKFLLHAGVLAVIGGAAVDAKFGRSGLIEVIEGQTLSLPGSAAVVRLDRFHPFFRSGRWHKGSAADLTVFEGGRSRDALVHVNRPASADGRSILLDQHGFAPFLRLEGAYGLLMDAYVSFETEPGPPIRYRRTLAIPGTAQSIALDFTPSPTGPLAKDPSISAELFDRGRSMRREVLRPGQSARLGDNRLAFKDVRYWAGLHVRRDPGLPLVYAGFVAAMAGSFLCFGKAAWS